MKILYIYQFFSIPQQGGISRGYYLAKALADAGMEVEVLTSHNQPHAERIVVENLTIHYLPAPYDQSFSTPKRLWAFLQFMVLAFRKAIHIQGVTRIYAVSTPLSIGLLAWGIKWYKGIPYYFEVGDLWPSVPVEMGVVRNSVLRTFLFFLEQKIYENATKIVALSPQIEQYIAKRGHQEKVVCIPNMADVAFFRPNPALTLIQPYVITYFGAIGKANHLEYLLEVAEYCQNIKANFRFQIVGKGSELPRLQALAQQMGLHNTKFLPFGGKEYLRDLLADTHLVYVSFLHLPILQTGSPNKLFDALAMGKPVVINFEGWLKEVLLQNECGLYASPESPKDFYEQALSLFQNYKFYAQNARVVAERDFSRKILCQRFVEIF